MVLIYNSNHNVTVTGQPNYISPMKITVALGGLSKALAENYNYRRWRPFPYVLNVSERHRCCQRRLAPRKPERKESALLGFHNYQHEFLFTHSMTEAEPRCMCFGHSINPISHIQIPIPIIEVLPFKIMADLKMNDSVPTSRALTKEYEGCIIREGLNTQNS